MRVALPSKGRLEEGALSLLALAGIPLERSSDRTLVGRSADGSVEALFVRSRDVPSFVESGVVDLGITGRDSIEESGCLVQELLDLGFGRCRLVLAAPEESPWRSLEDIPDGVRVATSFPRLTRTFFEKRGVRVNLVEVQGATEAAPHLGVADLIVDLSATGGTLEKNRLRVVETILLSSARLIAPPGELQAEPLERIVEALRSVVEARGKRYLMANVPRDRLSEVEEILPGISGPTVLGVLSHPEFVAAHAVVEEREVPRIVLLLKSLGATGILVLPIERLVP